MASRRILEPEVSPPAQEQFHGESLKSLSVPGFVLSECRYPPNFETPMHAHERALFCLAVEGAYTARYGPKTCTCEPSSPLFHAPNEMHSVHFQNSGGRFFIIEIEPWWLEWVREQGAVIDFSSDFKGGSLAMFGMNLYQEFLAMDGVSPLIVEGLMLAIIGKASRHATAGATSRPPRWLEQARQLMRDRFAETLTLAEIARNVGVSPSYLAQMFHKHYFNTVGGYVRQLRLEFACREMASSDAPLCEIALAAGFSDQSHLTRLFKRHMGIAPTQYRESLAGAKRKRENDARLAPDVKS
jgi:AraC family transcriptional regulator